MDSIKHVDQGKLAELGLSHKFDEAKKNELGQDEFLSLLVAQMRNQNPLDPQDNAQFLTQMAQFGTVDGVQKLQQSFSTLSNVLQSNQALQASALVGRSVLINADSGTLDAGGSIKGAVELPNSVADLKVSVYNAQGELVQQIPMGTHQAGMVEFNWSGATKDGNSAAAGNYVMKAEGTINGQQSSFTTYLYSNVDSVTLGKNNSSPVLNVAGIGAVTLSQIKQIS